MDWKPDEPIVGEGPQPVVGRTTTALKKGKTEGPETVKEETIGYTPVRGEPAKVGFAAGLTLSLGNYEMARVDVRLDYPSTATPEAVNKAFEYCKSWVAEKLQAEVNEVRSRQRG